MVKKSFELVLRNIAESKLNEAVNLFLYNDVMACSPEKLSIQ